MQSQPQGKSSPAKTLYWHDYETWGEVPSRDMPSQFAGVRTDEDLNIIDEPLMIYCKPLPDCLPKPDACLITGLTPQLALEKGLSEPEFVARIHRELSRPGTCGVGYNSIRFDDEVTRFALYRNFYDPYEREWRSGNSRWDIIDMVRMTRALRPDGIQWPNYEDGKPSFKLEMLTAANGLSHEFAHDALSDVYATIAIAKLIKTHQPKLYDYAYKLRDKRFASSLIDIAGHRPLLHISSRFAGERGNAALVLPLAMHPTNKNSVIVYNLSEDPTDLLQLPVPEMRLRLYTASADLPAGVSRLALKEVHLNKSPMLLPASMLDEATAERLGINKRQCEIHWQVLTGLRLEQSQELQHKLAEVFGEAFADKQDVEQMLYAGFFNDDDKKQLSGLRRANPDALGRIEFHDYRLNELLFRYRARHYPDFLSEQECQRWQEFCRQRLLDPEAGASLTLAAFRQRIQELSANSEAPSNHLNILKDLQIYADRLEGKFL